jgi:homoserine kinase
VTRPSPRTLVGREVAAPGSTSNLGPGFDAIGLALQIYTRVRIAAVDDERGGVLRWHFDTGAVEGENVIAVGFRRAAQAAGLAVGSLPSLTLHVASEVPVKAGLGSSAAAIVAGLRLLEAVAGPQPLARLLHVAAGVEGHPDNVSAALLGGFVVSAALPGGGVIARATAWPAAWRLVIATPEIALETRRARSILPDRVSREDAVFNVQRTALLVQAVATADGEALREATRDRLHQPYRAALVPGLERALAWTEPSVLAVFLSGAGPSLVAVVSGDEAPAVAEFESLYASLDLRCTVRRLESARVARSSGEVLGRPVADRRSSDRDCQA